MRKLFTLIAACMAAVSLTAQTITITDADGAIQQVSASEAGTMTYSQTDGTLTVGGQPVKVSSIAIDAENADIATTPVAGTTDAARQLYRYFRNNYGKRVISSVMADVP